jgi:5-methylcytosine-specific restriction endonuclease McrA
MRKRGMSYKAIAKAIPCSISTVHYFLTDGAKAQVVGRNRKRRRRISQTLKEAYGAACSVCGYDKCLEALEFDHIDPKDKVMAVSDMRGYLHKATAEAAKCLLLCCRCHRERHAGLLDIGAYLEPTL